MKWISYWKQVDKMLAGKSSGTRGRENDFENTQSNAPIWN